MRTPSLRELRRNCPANVVILPTAPARQVQQPCGPARAKARRELAAGQAIAFPYKPPWKRREEQEAQSLELRAGVPPFDPCNPAHLRTWEAIWEAARFPYRPEQE
jgi:hypothetical protein